MEYKFIFNNGETSNCYYHSAIIPRQGEFIIFADGRYIVDRVELDYRNGPPHAKVFISKS
jgi:hypothetical protein